ncbi:hypothetical protein LUZ61_014964 [Rhynchospora tenuis]|uniref:Uncharacterized protein n=1 Tax=Rhynchospora tenuis TaxID=198213 RepID=A0AAD5WC75_9POAL|nr:hypothetical protein LUZ61_014964 [Rhynchospora tenuis]
MAAACEREKPLGEPDTEIPSIEKLFEGREEIPAWVDQITLRSMVVSIILGFFISVMIMKLNLTTGIIPSFNVSAGLLGFFLMKSWTKTLQHFGVSSKPFTRQENTIIQTCVVACSAISYSGGLGSYILGMSSTVAKGFDDKATALDVKQLSLGWMIAYLFLTSFLGLFSVLPLRKVMILGYRLTYPSGTATAHVINGFHTPQGALVAKKQVSLLFKSFWGSFLWSLFQWFFSAGENCGFKAFPTFGLTAYENNFYFDFSATYVGVGMICPYLINISLLVGSFISWGMLWPWIKGKKGVWYDAHLPESSLSGLTGYKVFISIAMILGDGLFQFLAVIGKTTYDMYNKQQASSSIAPFSNVSRSDDDFDDLSSSHPYLTFDDRRCTSVFLKEKIPSSLVLGCYCFFAAFSMILIPQIFPQLQRRDIFILYLVAPLLAFSNAYGCGLTDWSLGSSYGKLAVFVFGAVAGIKDGGVVAGLAACGVAMGIVSTASDLMQDFKTGYLTLTSPRSMFVSQVIGTVMGCIIGPSVFWMFYKAYPIGDPNSEYPAPYARVYRGIAILGVDGFSALPKNCVKLCLAFFFFAFVVSATREALKKLKSPIYDYIPSAMGMAIPFYLGGYFTIDMCVGSLIMYIWRQADQRASIVYGPAVASGLICGDVIWALPSSILSLYKVKAPICMQFIPHS